MGGENRQRSQRGKIRSSDIQGRVGVSKIMVEIVNSGLRRRVGRVLMGLLAPYPKSFGDHLS